MLGPFSLQAQSLLRSGRAGGAFEGQHIKRTVHLRLSRLLSSVGGDGLREPRWFFVQELKDGRIGICELDVAGGSENLIYLPSERVNIYTFIPSSVLIWALAAVRALNRNILL